jgi:hypothetical protein
MVVRCPVGISSSGIVIEALVCGSDSVGIVKTVLWQVQCNMARSRSNGEDIMVVRRPVRCLGIVRRDRSCMLEQWATIHRYSHWTHHGASISSTIEFGSLGFHRQTQVNIPIVWITVSQSLDHYSTPYIFRNAREQTLNWISGR